MVDLSDNALYQYTGLSGETRSSHSSNNSNSSNSNSNTGIASAFNSLSPSEIAALLKTLPLGPKVSANSVLAQY